MPQTETDHAEFAAGTAPTDVLSAAQVDGAPETVVPRGRHASAIKAIDRVVDVIGAGIKVLVVLAMAAQVVLVVMAIVGRKFLHWAPASLEETAGYLFIWIVMLGTALTARDRSIPAIDLLARRLTRYDAGIRLFADLLTLLFFVFAARTGWSLFRQANAIASPGSGLPLGYAYAGVFLGGVVACVFVLAAIVRDLRVVKQELVALVAFAVVAVGYYELRYGPVLGNSQHFFVVLIVVLIASVALGVPVAVALGLAAFVAIDYDGSTPMVVVAQRMADGLNNFILLAIPFFLLAGHLMARSSLASRLLDVARAVVGRRRPGLATADILASVVFADMSGSAIADTAALGTVVMPELKKTGYTPARAAALQASAGALGIMFPPSVTMIIYASVANISVAQAFLSVIVPGLALTVAFIVVAYVQARRHGIDKGERQPARQRVRALSRGVPVLVVPVVILGGIFSGLATPAESGALAVLVTLVLSIGIFRDVKVRELGSATVEASMTVARVGFVIAAATALGWSVTAFNGPQLIIDKLVGLTSTPVLILLLVGFALILLHTVMDASATMLVVTPLLMPLLAQMNISLLHFGVLLDVTSAAGLIIPPLGFNLYIASHIAGVPVERAARAALPYLAATVVVAAVIIFIPSLSTWLPGLVHT